MSHERCAPHPVNTVKAFASEANVVHWPVRKMKKTRLLASKVVYVVAAFLQAIEAHVNQDFVHVAVLGYPSALFPHTVAELIHGSKSA